MNIDQKTLRRATVILHGLSFVLLLCLYPVFFRPAPQGLRVALLAGLIVCALAEGFVVGRYFRLSKDLEDSLSKSQVELLRQQLQNNEDRLNALQSQINPHFLYNTLETIREMALENGQKDLSRIIASLSLMFRYSMDFSNAVVPVEHELSQVERYMKLQQLRFPERYRLDIVKNADEQFLSHVMIPKFSIQPLVENAVRHAFKSMSSGCVLTIRLTGASDSFEIAVEDNGKGMDEAQVEALNETILYGRQSVSTDSEHNGIGMHNIYSRLQLYFGQQVSMYVCSTPEVGTIVRISLPVKHDD
ncbi:MAG: sensor histidine kinase [Erysipelotrichaceae bacterium]|nr:sensor histidine kinase [Erysipelotrichaceae bacterium]